MIDSGFDFLDPAWTQSCPSSSGEYLMRCFEVDYVEENVTVFRKPFNGLWCRCELGEMPVEVYHNGLTDISWLKR